jgi:hypothetical protein
MAPEFEKASKSLEKFKDLLQLAKVNCDQETEIRDRFKIEGYPTLLWFAKGTKLPIIYNGGHDFQSIVDFARRNIKSEATPNKSAPTIRDYNNEEFEAFIADTKSSGIVMFYAPCKINPG